MIDVLGCGDARENVTQTVTLSKLTGTRYDGGSFRFFQLILNLADDFISARQPQEGPSTQTVADSVVKEDVVEGHHLVHISVTESESIVSARHRRRKRCQDDKSRKGYVVSSAMPTSARPLRASTSTTLELLCHAQLRLLLPHHFPLLCGVEVSYVMPPLNSVLSFLH